MATYPHVITFSLPPDSRYRRAVEGAARDLNLPLEIRPNGDMRVTVSGPGEAFRFGEETAAHLESLVDEQP